MKMRKTNRYAARGVSTQKGAVHKATAILDKGLYPGAFCQLFQDRFRKNCVESLHADTAGTIPSLAALVYVLTDDLELASQVAVNSAVMNLEDGMCVGAVNNFLINQTIAYNNLYFGTEKADALNAALIAKLKELCDTLRQWGIEVCYAGGEIASCGNNIRTFDIGNTVHFSIPKSQVIDASKMAPGDFIIGFASGGRPAAWETKWNSGIGSNGLTSAFRD